MTYGEIEQKQKYANSLAVILLWAQSLSWRDKNKNIVFWHYL
jgi:hypothetical protein